MENKTHIKQPNALQIKNTLDFLLKDIVKDTDIDNVKNAEKNTKLLTEKIEKLSI